MQREGPKKKRVEMVLEIKESQRLSSLYVGFYESIVNLCWAEKW
jgi:hypothetical protein